MNGVHDLGGMDGFGPVRPEADEPVFHTRWESRVFAIAALLLPRRLWSVDAFRHAIETLPPTVYLGSPYYGRWLRAIEKLLARAGVVRTEEVESRVRALVEGSTPVPAAASPSPPSLGLPGFLREVEGDPRFRVGQRVRACNLHPRGHTRLPRYVRGRVGTVVRSHPACVFPDTHAHGRGENPQYVYAVRFDGGELWGEDAEPGTSVSVDLFESYLEDAA